MSPIISSLAESTWQMKISRILPCQYCLSWSSPNSHDCLKSIKLIPMKSWWNAGDSSGAHRTPWQDLWQGGMRYWQQVWSQEDSKLMYDGFMHRFCKREMAMSAPIPGWRQRKQDDLISLASNEGQCDTQQMVLVVLGFSRKKSGPHFMEIRYFR